MRVDERFKIAAGVGLRDGEKAVVETHFSIDGVSRADPVDSAFYLAIRVRAAGFALEISGATQLDDFA